MIIVSIPDNNFNSEITYICKVIFEEFLGVNIKLIPGKANSDYIINLENQSKLIIKNHFFNDDKKEYLEIDNIPDKIIYSKNEFALEDNVPVIYGNNLLEINDNEIICGIDIFASSFFMLTRWEEYVNTARDNHGRFPSSESLAVKSGFHKRPVVNEYVEMLWNMLKHLGIEEKRKERNFQFINSHDVDHIYYDEKTKYIFLRAAGDIIKRKNVKTAISRIHEHFRIIFGKKQNPNDTFDYIMALSEKHGLKSRFYFMGCNDETYDARYSINDPKVIELIKNISERKHIIGIHGSYNSYNDSKMWKEEKERIEYACELKINDGRQHYLKFEVPQTWQIWDDNDMVFDSTLGYSDKQGFRCGTCYEFPVFNIITRKKLALKEMPLIVMEGNFDVKQRDDEKFIQDTIFGIIKIIRKYNGNFILLWHNSSFNTIEWKNGKKLYEKILQYMSESKNQ